MVMGDLNVRVIGVGGKCAGLVENQATPPVQGDSIGTSFHLYCWCVCFSILYVLATTHLRLPSYQ